MSTSRSGTLSGGSRRFNRFSCCCFCFNINNLWFSAWWCGFCDSGFFCCDSDSSSFSNLGGSLISSALYSLSREESFLGICKLELDTSIVSQKQIVIKERSTLFDDSHENFKGCLFVVHILVVLTSKSLFADTLGIHGICPKRAFELYIEGAVFDMGMADGISSFNVTVSETLDLTDPTKVDFASVTMNSLTSVIDKDLLTTG